MKQARMQPMSTHWPRFAKTSALLSIAAGLSACASLNAIDSEVASYNQWPAQRQAGSYRFERLPSQHAQGDRQTRLESSAAVALESAGFKPATDVKTPDYIVQIAARANRADVSPYDDPFWWRGGLYASRYGRRGYGPYYGRAWGPYPYAYDSPRYEREVMLLIRDRKTSEVLYETRAATEGNTTGNAALIRAMFLAAMKDFPVQSNEPRIVRVELSKP